MSNDKIGIKLADGSFYPILEEGIPKQKKLILTTVRDGQTTVQLDLYKSMSDSIENADYVDSLYVENLLPRPKETPSLELKIGLDENDILSAEIEDAESGEHNALKASLVKLEENKRSAIPDFSMVAVHDIDENKKNAEENMDKNNDDFNLDDFGDIDSLMADDSDTLANISVDDNDKNAPEENLSNNDAAFDEIPVAGNPSDTDFAPTALDASVSSDDAASKNIGDTFLDLDDTILGDSASSDDAPKNSATPESDFSSFEGLGEDANNDFSNDVDAFSLPEIDDNDFATADSALNDDSVNAQNATTSSSQDMGYGALYDKDTFDESSSRKKKKVLIPILIACACLLLCLVGVLLFFVFGKNKKADTKVATTNPPVTETIIEEEPVAEENLGNAKEDEIVIVETPVVAPASPVETKTATDVIKYKIKWGDTLWDISATYYKNPWLYIMLAEYNNIENPDLIISGTTIDIPPR